jgi:hypothetical protein
MTMISYLGYSSLLVVGRYQDGDEWPEVVPRLAALPIELGQVGEPQQAEVAQDQKRQEAEQNDHGELHEAVRQVELQGDQCLIDPDGCEDEQQQDPHDRHEVCGEGARHV